MLFASKLRFQTCKPTLPVNRSHLQLPGNDFPVIQKLSTQRFEGLHSEPPG